MSTEPTEPAKNRNRLGWVLIGLFLSTCLFGWLFFRTRNGSIGKDGRITTLVEDSIATHQELRRTVAIADSLQSQITTSLNTAFMWKQEGERKDAAVREANKQLSYSQKLSRYYQNLVASGDLSPAVAAENPPPENEQVVAGGLDATEASKRKDETIQYLGIDLANNQQKIDALNQSLLQSEKAVLSRDTMMVNIRVSAIDLRERVLDKATGGLWPLNIKRKKEERAIAQDIKQTFIDKRK